jgi:Thioredoxin-like proteins and domains
LNQKLFKILEEKIRPAVARDGGDIKFKEFKWSWKGSTSRKLSWLSKFQL